MSPYCQRCCTSKLRTGYTKILELEFFSFTFEFFTNGLRVGDFPQFSKYTQTWNSHAIEKKDQSCMKNNIK